MAGGIEDIGLWAPVQKGEVYQTPTPDNSSPSYKGTTKLGKDAFLKLLVAQMQYQDPLNPTSDTEWIAQMATFSTLEEMQNMGTTMSNSQALSLVGKAVIINSDNHLIGGTVDYVMMEGGKAYLVVGDGKYSLDELDSVASEEYIKSLQNNGTLDGDVGKSDTEKILDSVGSVGSKLDTIGESIEKIAEALNSPKAPIDTEEEEEKKSPTE